MCALRINMAISLLFSLVLRKSPAPNLVCMVTYTRYLNPQNLLISKCNHLTLPNKTPHPKFFSPLIFTSALSNSGILKYCIGFRV